MKELARIEGMSLTELRDQVMEKLTQEFSRDLIGMDEYERRAHEAAMAQTKAALIAVVADLPALGGAETLPGAAPAKNKGPRPGEQWQVSSERVQAEGSAICVFGATDRKGVWRAPRTLDTICVFGGANLDFRKAIVPPEGVTLNCVALFGGVDIIVPPGMRVEVSGMGIMGGFDHTHNEIDDPDAPLIRVEGIAIFGGVSVRVKD